ncbi:MAG: hypothetical protein ACHQQQ_07075 [Bacteroidota bacterium]
MGLGIFKWIKKIFGGSLEPEDKISIHPKTLPNESINKIYTLPQSSEIHVPGVSEDDIYRVRSFTDPSKFYTVDLFKETCTCQDFVDRKIVEPIHTCGRWCKHLRCVMARLPAIQGTILEPVLNEKYLSKNILRLDVPEVIFGFKDGKEWITVYGSSVSPDTGEINYARFGYNLNDQRWSYNNSPQERSKIEKAIKRFFPVGNRVVLNVNNDYFPPNDIHNLDNNYIELEVLISPKLRKKPKPESFDLSYFINSETHKFIFPQYKHDKKFKVKIKDNTNYARLFSWNDRWNDFTLSNFEDWFDKPNVEVDEFDEYLNDLAISECDITNKFGEELNEICREIKEDKCARADTDYRKRMMETGYFDKYEFPSTTERDKYIEECLSKMKVDELRKTCTIIGVRTKYSGKKILKDEALQAVIQSGRISELIDHVPQPFILGEKFICLLDSIYDSYINDIKDNLKRFHPYYLQEIWNVVLRGINNNAHPKLALKIKDIIESKYWESLLSGD